MRDPIPSNKFKTQASSPFHPLSFELLRASPVSKLQMQETWSHLAGTTYLPEQATLFSEWPLVASTQLQEKLEQRALALCEAAAPYLAAERLDGWQHKHHADVLTIDYALVADGENWDLRLVEFQAFTSLLATGYHIQQSHAQLWPALADCVPWQKPAHGQTWQAVTQSWLCKGEQTAILEFQPWKRSTLFDLHASSLLWNAPLIEPHQVAVDAKGRLWFDDGKQRLEYDSLLNRLILNELKDEGQCLRHLQRAQIQWHSHPAWYYLVHKGLASEMVVPFEPQNVRADVWRSLGLAPQDVVAKNIYSCAGKDLYIGPTAMELDQLSQPQDWIIQPRFQAYPVMHNSQGEPVFAELRLVVQIAQNAEPWIAMQIVRLYYGKQASASFFQGREGEGVTVLHRPPSFD